MISAKKWRKTIEWERLEISSRKLEIPTEYFMQRWAQKWYGPNREENIKKGWQQYTEELYKRDLNDQDNHDGVITRQSQTSWNAKSSGP